MAAQGDAAGNSKVLNASLDGCHGGHQTFPVVLWTYVELLQIAPKPTDFFVGVWDVTRA